MIHSTVPEGLTLALYKGTQPGLSGLYSHIARFVDRGPYSHTELIIPGVGSASSSFLDRGVRIKQINYSSVGDWDFLPIPDRSGFLAGKATDWYLAHNGEPYDVLGNLRFGSNLFSHSKSKWFCSESNIEALGFIQGFRYGPNGALAFLQSIFNTELVKVDKPASV